MIDTPEVRIDPTGITFPEEWTGTIDVLFDDHRAMSILATRYPPVAGVRTLPWPRAIQPRLEGAATVVLRDHLSRRELARREVVFGGPDRRVSFRNAEGHLLALDKWGRLDVTFLNDSGEVAALLLSDLDQLFDDMAELGVDAFLAYGSLLGAHRSGAFIPHDTDADIAWVSKHEEPALVIREGFAIERGLRSLGWSTLRLTAGFFKVWGPTNSQGGAVDVFTGYFRGSTFAVDRWVRGEMAREDMLPLGTVTLEGHSFPAPANPDRLLELTYGPHWRVPDPSFKFETPASTMRRARGWFGGHRWTTAGRPSPEERHTDPSPADAPSDFARWTLSRLGAADVVLEAGCRAGADALFWSARVRRVLAFDHVHEQIAAAAAQAAERGAPVDFERGSFHDLRYLVSAAARTVAAARDGGRPVVCARRVVEQLTPAGRERFWLMARTALVGGGRLFLEVGSGADLEAVLAAAGARGAQVEHREPLADGSGHRCELSWRQLATTRAT